MSSMGGSGLVETVYDLKCWELVLIISWRLPQAGRKQEKNKKLKKEMKSKKVNSSSKM